MIDVAAPGATPVSRSKKWPESENGTPFYVNIMGDPRVCRGPVHGMRAAPIPAPGAPPAASIAKRKHSRCLKLPSLDELHKSIQAKREFKPVPIHLYLEEQNVEPVVHWDQALQTDKFMPAAPDSPYIPAKIGLDIATQIDPDSGDLFNFDDAIDPTVRVIVSKTLEQALIEVRMETDLASLAERKSVANRTQQEQDRITADLEHNAAEKRAETEQLLQNEKERVRKESIVIQKANCLRISSEYLSSLQSRVELSLVDRGFLCSRAEAEVTDVVLPFLARAVAERLSFQSSVKDNIVDNIVRHALSISVNKWQDERAQAEREREDLRALERVRGVEINLHLRLPELEARLLGPVAVRNGQTIADAQTAVRTWLRKYAPDLAEESAELLMQFSLQGAVLPYDRVIMDVGLLNLSTLDLTFVKDS